MLYIQQCLPYKVFLAQCVNNQCASYATLLPKTALSVVQTISPATIYKTQNVFCVNLKRQQ